VEKSGYDELIRCILSALNYKVSQILLYGPAAAKGSSWKGKLDIAVITPYKISDDQEARLSDAVAALNKKHGGRYSVIDVDVNAFAEMTEEIPLFLEIMRTGVLLWPE
jgi:hypothetical protein